MRPGIGYGVLGPLFLMFYRTAPTVADLRAREPYFQHICAQPSGGAFLSIIDGREATGFPDDAARAETKRQAEKFGARLVAGAVVLEGVGVRATLIRSFVRGLLLFKSTPMPYRFFATVDDATSHLLRELRLSGIGPLAAVGGAVEDLRRRTMAPATETR